MCLTFHGLKACRLQQLDLASAEASRIVRVKGQPSYLGMGVHIALWWGCWGFEDCEGVLQGRQQTGQRLSQSRRKRMRRMQQGALRRSLNAACSGL
jgi:hypothetical protein